MKLQKNLALLALSLGATATLTACGSDDNQTQTNDNDNLTAVIVTLVGGVDDKSFTQSAWEGLTEWGNEHGLEKGRNGYDYIQSNSESDYVNNFNLAINSGYDLIFGTGFKFDKSMTEVASVNPESQFVLVDSVVDLPNVASVTFKDNEAAFLAGVAAAETTKTNKVGFIGGMPGPVLDRFQAGYTAGVHAVNPDIDVEVQYADTFVDASKGKALANAMYANDVDVIFHCAGGAGNGVFTEAKEIVSTDPSREVWVIGVDQDQAAEGAIDDNRNITLTSTLKGVGQAVQKMCDDASNGIYHGGTHIELGLADNGVGLTEGQLSEEAKAKIEEYKVKIIDGSQVVPQKPEKDNE
ncbi:nucleoside-binding protein [Granulicatella balaenopterae]|uniref:Nucleoside-binding protein n=1 Tax=Granulicatella balaenopterae TaxID=137733 RepID=A0A1H9MNB2_9LACT|nr:BMP family protein [Granulicatella balaenopterae]SER25186.1 nucleoside-binding protein [Granulicatella balaenopterae]